MREPNSKELESIVRAWRRCTGNDYIDPDEVIVHEDFAGATVAVVLSGETSAMAMFWFTDDGQVRRLVSGDILGYGLGIDASDMMQPGERF